MENKDFSRKLEDRTKRFAISVIHLSSALPNTTEGKVIRNQFIKSGTSVGSNYMEANRSRSKTDFYNKIKICESETSETAYWLELIDELNWSTKAKIDEVHNEANELLALFTSIGKSLRNPKP